jgi:hypothetical protein
LPILLLLLPSEFSIAQSCPGDQHPKFMVTIAPGLADQAVSGRLILLMSNQPGPAGKLEPSYGPEARDVWLTAEEVHNLTPGESVELNPDELAYPEKLCMAPAGRYGIKAVLDVHHSYAYDRDASDGDLVGTTEQDVDPRAHQTIWLTLTQRTTDPPLHLPPHTEVIDFVSRRLSEFWGSPIHMRGLIVLPPGYAAGKQHYPTVYVNHGFGGDMKYLALRLATNWVLLLQASPTGTHEFADSVNNGPWGEALTTELIPYLEKKYRMDARPNGRFLTGHSSGGWASLWLQVRYPAFFGGAWPTAPDTADFRNFAGVNIAVRPPQNMYRDQAGAPRMFIRMEGKDTQSLEDIAAQERVLGEYGGQLQSFEWVFSPRAQDGRPMPLFDRDTGAVDADVARYWLDHYDIANRLRKNWKTIGPLVNGKIHLTVGTADTFHLDEAARLLEQTIKDLGGKASFNYIEGKTHFDLYAGGLAEEIAKQMYAVARPATNFHQPRHPPSGPTYGEKPAH